MSKIPVLYTIILQGIEVKLRFKCDLNMTNYCIRTERRSEIGNKKGTLFGRRSAINKWV